MLSTREALFGKGTRPPWDKGRDTRPCGYLASGNECPHLECQRSHDPDRISRAKVVKNDTNRKCIKGAACSAHEMGCCCYYHPPPHQSRRQRKARVEDMLRGLQLVQEFAMDDSLLSDGRKPARIQNVKRLASFNKLIGGQIVVPGCPPALTLLNSPMLLQFDSENKDIQPEYPTYRYELEPLLRSVEMMSPDFDLLESTDIVASSGTLRRIFLFLQADKYALPKVNRCEIEWRNHTLFLSKWADDPEFSYSAGRGAGFEQKTCRHADDAPDVLKQSTSHHRVVSYTLGRLRLAVQSEVDAWLPTAAVTRPTPARPAPPRACGTTRRDSGVAFGPSARGFELLAMDDPGDTTDFSEQPAAAASDSSPSLRIHWPCGTDVPPDRLVEVKTHEAANAARFFPETQLYFSRTSLMYHATHKEGLFKPSNAGVRDMLAEVNRWEAENSSTLGRLVGFLDELKKIVGEYAAAGGCMNFSLVCDGSSKRLVTRLYARGDGVHLLPPVVD